MPCCFEMPYTSASGWPGPPTSTTRSSLATWLTARLAYLDQVFGYQPLATVGAAGAALNFQLYPNPARGYLYVQANAAVAQLDILDMSGRRVLQATLPGGPARLDISSLPLGMYLARFSGAGGVAVKKLLID